MKHMRAWLLSGVLLCVLWLPARAEQAEFPDVSGHWARETIQEWQNYGVVNGDARTGEFRPDDAMTRAELAAVLERIMGYQQPGEEVYSDVPAGAWYARDLARLSAAGVLTGYGDGTMRPNAQVTRQEAAVMLCRAFELQGTEGAASFEDWAEVASWAAGYVKTLSDRGVVQGYKGCFQPQVNVTRAQVLTMLDKLTAGVVTRDGVWTQDAEGDLIVNAQDVTLKDMEVTGNLIVAEGVGEGEVTLSNVTVTGDVILRGCGANSFHIAAGSQVKGRLIVTKTTTGQIRVVNESGETIPMVYVNDGVSGVTIEGDVGTLVVACDTPVRLRDGKVDTLSVTAPKAQVTVEDGSRVARLDVGGKAANAQVSVEGAVDTLVTNAPAKVSNNGTIGKVQVAADGLVLDGKKPSRVTVDSGVKKPVDPSGKEISTSGGSSSGGSSSGGSSSGGSSSGGSSSGGSSGDDTDAPIPVSQVELQLMAPAFGDNPDSADELGAGYTAQTEWRNADGTPPSYRWQSDTFTANQAYKAIVTLTPNSGYAFASSVTVKVVDGEGKNYTPESVTADGGKRIVTLKYAPTADRDPVEALSVTGPSVLKVGGTGLVNSGFRDNALVDPATYAYQWYRADDPEAAGTAISGATEKNYTIEAADVQSPGTVYFSYRLTVTVKGETKEYASPVWPVEVKANSLDPDLIPKVKIEAYELQNLECRTNLVYGDGERAYDNEGLCLDVSTTLTSVYEGAGSADLRYRAEVALREHSVRNDLNGDSLGEEENNQLGEYTYYYNVRENDTFGVVLEWELQQIYRRYAEGIMNGGGAIESWIHGGTITVTPQIYDVDAQEWVSLPDKADHVEFDWEASYEEEKISRIRIASYRDLADIGAAGDVTVDMTAGTVTFTVPERLRDTWSEDGPYMLADAEVWLYANGAGEIKSVAPDQNMGEDNWQWSNRRLTGDGQLTQPLHPQRFEQWVADGGLLDGAAEIRGGIFYYTREDLGPYPGQRELYIYGLPIENFNVVNSQG